MNPIRVLLVDDQAIVRAGIRAMLRDLDEIEVVGEASNGQEALAMIDSSRPDVLLMDLAMPVMNGLEATAVLAREAPNLRVIIISVHTGEDYVERALRLGAAGYLAKDTNAHELELAIRTVADGETYVAPSISMQVVVEHYRQPGRDAGAADALTPRQQEVLKWIAEGKATKEIARILGISVKTVETHRTQLMERLHIHHTVGLVRYAMRAGLIPPETPIQI